MDSKEASEIIQSRPMPLFIADDGAIEPMDDFPWPKHEKDIEERDLKKIEDIIRFIQTGKF